MSEYKPTPYEKQFRFWCHKIIPLIYDDSWSYLETVCHVVDHLNGMVTTINNLIDNFDTYREKTDQHITEIFNQFKQETTDFLNQKFIQYQAETNQMIHDLVDQLRSELITLIPKVVQVSGQSTTDVMSQKAVTDLFNSLGTVLTYKGAVADVGNLPTSGNKVGDVYYVESKQSAYAWVIDTANPQGHWEEFGPPFDISQFVVQTTGTATDKVMSQKAATDAFTLQPATVYQLGGITALPYTANPHAQSYPAKIDSSNNQLYVDVPNGGIDKTFGLIVTKTPTADQTERAGIDSQGYVVTRPITGGGGGPTVVQTTGTSTTDVMSQNASTDLLVNKSQLADPTAPPAHPISVNQVAVYSTTNQTYNPNDVQATLLVADPHSDMEAVNKRTVDHYLPKSNINDSYERVTSYKKDTDTTEYHILDNTDNPQQGHIPLYNARQTISVYTENVGVPRLNDVCSYEWITKHLGPFKLATFNNNLPTGDFKLHWNKDTNTFSIIPV